MSKITPFSLPTAPEATPKVVGPRVVVNLPPRRPGEKPVEQDADRDPAIRLRELEARMAILETAIVDHAMVLRDRIAQRLDRLEQKFRHEADGLRRALQTETSDRKTNIIRLAQSVSAAVDRVESGQQQGHPVHTTMQDLVSALADTRTHLDGLSRAVSPSGDGLAS
jgi:hypothetical protein